MPTKCLILSHITVIGVVCRDNAINIPNSYGIAVCQISEKKKLANLHSNDQAEVMKFKHEFL